MKTPQFLRQLLSSSEYMDKNSKAYAMAEKYLNLLYPGTAQIDATGRMTEPEYDMTLTQFNKAQDALDAALEEAKQEAEAEYEEAGQEIDIDAYVELEETIDVRVLMPLGTIENKQLEVYTLDLPEDDDDTPNNKTRRVWRWHAEEGDNTCDECASRDGALYESEDDIPDIPVHPNCCCSITEDVIDAAGRTLSSKPYSAKKKEVEMNKVLTQELKDTLKHHEGIKEHAYLDSKKILTIGIGNNVSKLENFMALNLIDAKNGHTLSNAEKETLHSQMMTDIKAGTFSEKNYSQYHVPISEMESKFNQQLEQSYHELERKIPDFQTLPIPAQQALLDMQFNIGTPKFSQTEWPKLFAAVVNKDWATAAQESHRKDIQQSRQDWTYNKFLQAL